MINRLLYIGSKIQKIEGGANVVNWRNQRLLERFTAVTYMPLNGGSMTKLYLWVTDEVLSEVEKELRTNTYRYLFVQQSTLGRVCAFVKKRFPEVKIIVFFHNIEKQYAREYMKVRGLRALPFYLLASHWERVACRYADYCITLNKRDSDLLERCYDRKANLELPTSFADKYSKQRALEAMQHPSETPIDFLFVGSAFFANVEGVQWFIDHVMPHVEGHLYIVGKGMDKVRFSHVNSRVHICGFVDDLSELYYQARMVVLPIRVGGGMKTKTAEALMYGKTIIGTREAFEGYKMDERATFRCDTAEEWVETLNREYESNHAGFNEFSRHLFVSNYSDSVMEDKLQQFLNSIDDGK